MSYGKNDRSDHTDTERAVGREILSAAYMLVSGAIKLPDGSPVTSAAIPIEVQSNDGLRIIYCVVTVDDEQVRDLMQMSNQLSEVIERLKRLQEGGDHE